MPQVTEAAQTGAPWICVAVLVVGCLLILSAWARIWWLGQRHASLTRAHEDLEERCDVLERDAREHRSALASIDVRLVEIRADGKRNTELLHTLVYGHVAASKE